MSRLQAHNYIPRGADLKPSSCEGKAVCCLACTPSTFDSACFQERRSSVSFLHKGPEKGYHISDYIHNPFAYIKQEEISLPQSGTGYINIRSFWTHGFFLLDGFLVLLAIYSESWMFFFFLSWIVLPLWGYSASLPLMRQWYFLFSIYWG